METSLCALKGFYHYDPKYHGQPSATFAVILIRDSLVSQLKTLD